MMNRGRMAGGLSLLLLVALCLCAGCNGPVREPVPTLPTAPPTVMPLPERGHPAP